MIWSNVFEGNRFTQHTWQKTTLHFVAKDKHSNILNTITGCRGLFVLQVGSWEKLAANTLVWCFHVNYLLLCYGDSVFSATVCWTAHQAEQTTGHSHSNRFIPNHVAFGSVAPLQATGTNFS